MNTWLKLLAGIVQDLWHGNSTNTHKHPKNIHQNGRETIAFHICYRNPATWLRSNRLTYPFLSILGWYIHLRICFAALGECSICLDYRVEQLTSIYLFKGICSLRCVMLCDIILTCATCNVVHFCSVPSCISLWISRNLYAISAIKKPSGHNMALQCSNSLNVYWYAISDLSTGMTSS